MILCQEDKTLC